MRTPVILVFNPHEGERFPGEGAVTFAHWSKDEKCFVRSDKSDWIWPTYWAEIPRGDVLVVKA